MKSINPVHLMLIGFFLCLMGVVLPLLMIIPVNAPVITNTFFLSFLSYASSISGVVMGITGAAFWTRTHRKKIDK